MDYICGSPFWQANLTWNITTQPDFTPCFQETILAWIPTLFFLIFTPLEIIAVCNSPRRHVPLTLLNIFKIFLTTVLCILSVADLSDAIMKNQSSHLVDYLTPTIRAITYALVITLIVFHRDRGVHTSGLLLIFWLLVSVVAIINARSLIRSTFQSTLEPVADWQISELKFTLRIISTPIIIVQLILACLADKRAQDPFIPTGENYLNRSPEGDSSILSRITFSWLDSLVWLGYKRALTQDDLYAVPPTDRTEVICQRFDELLEPAIEAALNARRGISHADTADDNATAEEPLSRGSSSRGSWINLVRKRSNLRNEATKYGDSTKRGPSATGGSKGGDSKESNNDEPTKYVSIFSIIFKTYRLRLILSALLKLCDSVLIFASPLLLGCIINFISSKEPAWRGYLYSFGLFILSIMNSIITNREQYITNCTVMRIKTCVTSALYRKTLRLSPRGRKNHTSGQIVNLMSTDSQRIADFVQNLNGLLSAPVQLVICMVLLYQQLGNAIFAGLGIMLVNGPFNAWIALKLRTLQQTVMGFKDKRIKLLGEIINGIKVIKIHAWENAFQDRTEEIRGKEIKFLTRQTWYSAAITFAFVCMPTMVALASFVFYILIDKNNNLDAEKIFVSISLFNIIRIPLALLPMLITNFSMSIIAIRRINHFFESDEIDPKAVEPIDDDRNVIKIEDGTFRWDDKSEFLLDKINLQIPRRKLVAVVGPVGSGKSSLLSAILSDMEKIKGRLMVDSSSNIAYVPQEAWIMNASVKNNIMLNKVVNEERYQKVVDACALVPDFKTLSKGDRSEIGEKGINLSGGQKQRVSLARAVYADTDIYLLDDPLSAVDAHVGRHIFDRIIGPRGMLSGRTRLLVTNKLSVLPEVDYILVIKDGQISEMGTYKELLTSKGLFSQLLVKYLTDNFEGQINISDDARADIITTELKRLEANQLAVDRKLSQDSNQSSSSKNDVPGKSQLDEAKKQPSSHEPGNLTGQEVTQVGSVGIDVHLNFIRNMGMNFVIALCIYVISSVFTVAYNLWLSDWSNDATDEVLRNSTSQRNLRLGVYAALTISESSLVIVSTILLNMACLRGSQILHNRMLERILRAPMSWFNTTPSGRIINRFSKDIDTIDVTIRFNVRILMVLALRSMTSLILMSVGSVYSIIFICPIVLLYFLFQIFYISTSRQLKRIESTTRSPIYTHFSETISGATSIRALGISQQFVLESNHRIDVNNASYYIGFNAARWLSMRLESLGFLVVLTVSMAAILSQGSISPGIAGLSVTYSLQITSVLSFLVRTYSDYESNVVSVERLLEYTRTPIEPENEDVPADPDWPSQGIILYENYSARYRPELDLVIKEFNLLVKPSEKIGLVGRTGAGKSSIALSLFRMIEAADGHIVIDEVDISHINLKVLRSKLSVIPQEPVLFTGTVRQNVDPTCEYTDEQVWRSIEMAHLGDFLRSLPDGLAHEVNEGGSNFSVGQRQLFCLARALLRNSKILILDEATATVDLETDNLIQQTIRKEFKNSTILTIAHRLETIQDYDRIVVLDQGAKVEEGSPSDLIKKPSSKFYSLAKEAGITK